MSVNQFISTEDIDLGKIKHGEIPIIKAPVGYGKTYYATHILPGIAKADTPMMLVPTKAIKWQTINDYDDAIRLESMDLLERNNDSYVRVACFSAIAAWLSEGNKILNRPDLLILDEIDELAKWSMCFDGYLQAWDWLLANRNKMKIVGLTATPELLTDYVAGISFVNVARDLMPKFRAKAVEVIQHSSVITYLKTIEYNADNKVIVYLQSAKQCAQMARKYPDAGFIISEYNTDTLGDDEKELRELMKEQTVKD